jgi:hypothetical protein
VYWRSMTSDDDLLDLAEAKIEHWKTADGGLALYPNVSLSIIDPPLDGAVLRVSGSILNEGAKVVLGTYLEKEEPKLMPGEYLMDLAIGSDSPSPEGNGLPDYASPVVLPFETDSGSLPNDQKLASPFSSDLLFGDEKRESWAPEAVKQRQTGGVQEQSQVISGSKSGKRSLGDILNSVK